MARELGARGKALRQDRPLERLGGLEFLVDLLVGRRQLVGLVLQLRGALPYELIELALPTQKLGGHALEHAGETTELVLARQHRLQDNGIE